MGMVQADPTQFLKCIHRCSSLYRLGLHPRTCNDGGLAGASNGTAGGE